MWSSPIWDAFDEDRPAVEDLKERYRRGGLGDVAVKRHLEEVLQDLLAPIRRRREELARDPGQVLDILRAGTARAREVTQSTLDEVRMSLGLFTLDSRSGVAPSGDLRHFGRTREASPA